MNKNTSVSGRRWAIFKRVDIPDVSNPDRVYLTRWMIVLTPYFAIYLHKINLTDGDRNMHDHPWTFTSLVLKGGYMETVWAPIGPRSAGAFPRGVVARHRGSLHTMRRGTYHRISRLFETPTWTLCFVGPRRGDWGFYVPGRGWVQYQEYLDEFYGGVGARPESVTS